MDPENHQKYFLNQISICADYFEKWLYPSENIFFENYEPVKKSLYCNIYDAFEKHNRAKRNNQGIIVHNCVGCNFEEGGQTINYFLQSNKSCLNVQYYLNLYSFLFYAQAERLAVIYKEIGYTNNKSEFVWEQFPNLQLIKYWANFFKHPKSYMFLHHPDYFIETDPERPNMMISHVIDNSFVKEFYRAKANNGQLREILENKENVKVFFPDLIITTKTLCNEFGKIVDTITSDSKIIEKLDMYTTVDSIFGK